MIVLILVPASVVSLAGIIYPFKPFKKRWVALVSFFVCSIIIGDFGPMPEATETAMPEVNERLWAAPNATSVIWAVG